MEAYDPAKHWAVSKLYSITTYKAMLFIVYHWEHLQYNTVTATGGKF
jgi:hypothetical protein